MQISMFGSLIFQLKISIIPDSRLNSSLSPGVNQAMEGRERNYIVTETKAD
jgi:hypothetical protein